MLDVHSLSKLPFPRALPQPPKGSRLRKALRHDGIGNQAALEARLERIEKTLA